MATFSVGIGFDAAVVEAAERKPYAKLRFGGVYYASTAVGRLTSDWRTRLPNLRIEANGDSFDAIAALTQVHHPYTYFGRVPLHLTKEDPKGMATLAVGKLAIATRHHCFTGHTPAHPYGTLRCPSVDGI